MAIDISPSFSVAETDASNVPGGGAFGASDGFGQGVGVGGGGPYAIRGASSVTEADVLVVLSPVGGAPHA